MPQVFHVTTFTIIALAMPTDMRIYIYILGFFEKQLEKSEINTRALTTATYYARARSAQEIDDLEERLREHEVRILQMNNSHEKLQRKYLQLTELRHVLRETAVFFEQVWINVA